MALGVARQEAALGVAAEAADFTGY